MQFSFLILHCKSATFERNFFNLGAQNCGTVRPALFDMTYELCSKKEMYQKPNSFWISLGTDFSIIGFFLDLKNGENIKHHFLSANIFYKNKFEVVSSKILIRLNAFYELDGYEHRPFFLLWYFPYIANIRW